MSLELALKKNADIFKECTEVMRQLISALQSRSPNVAQTETVTPALTLNANSEETPEEVLDNAKAVLLSLVKINRDEGVNLLARFGAKKLGEVPTAQLPELIIEAKTLLEALDG